MLTGHPLDATLEHVDVYASHRRVALTIAMGRVTEKDIESFEASLRFKVDERDMASVRRTVYEHRLAGLCDAAVPAGAVVCAFHRGGVAMFLLHMHLVVRYDSKSSRKRKRCDNPQASRQHDLRREMKRVRENQGQMVQCMPGWDRRFPVQMQRARFPGCPVTTGQGCCVGCFSKGHADPVPRKKILSLLRPAAAKSMQFWMFGLSVKTATSGSGAFITAIERDCEVLHEVHREYLAKARNFYEKHGETPVPLHAMFVTVVPLDVISLVDVRRTMPSIAWINYRALDNMLNSLVEHVLLPECDAYVTSGSAKEVALIQEMDEDADFRARRIAGTGWQVRAKLHMWQDVPPQSSGSSSTSSSTVTRVAGDVSTSLHMSAS